MKECCVCKRKAPDGEYVSHGFTWAIVPRNGWLSLQPLLGDTVYVCGTECADVYSKKFREDVDFLRGPR